LFPDTINQVFIDLYLAFQQTLEEDVDSRKKIKQHILESRAAFKSWRMITSNGIHNHQIEDTANQYLRTEVFQVIKFILGEYAEHLPYIPVIFSKIMHEIGMDLSVEEFYKYRD
jgi:hypothetical protein